MFRSASRTLLRPARSATTPLRFTPGTRSVNTSAQSGKSRSWRGTAVRWGLAVGAVYYYNTSPVFADERPIALHSGPSQENEDTPLPTIESVSAAKKRRAELEQQRQPLPEQSSTSTVATESQAESPEPAAAAGAEAAPADAPQQLSADELEDEADQQGAFNPETGEINWDCPCLGGMAHGPCGEDFKAAFSCFVYSTEEPKGMDCIDKFKDMQDCFRLYPDIYGSEIDDSEVDEQLTEQIAAEDQANTERKARTDQEEASSSDDSLPDPKQVQRQVEKDLDTGNTMRAPKEWQDTSGKNIKAEKEQQKDEKKQ